MRYYQAALCCASVCLTSSAFGQGQPPPAAGAPATFSTSAGSTSAGKKAAPTQPEDAARVGDVVLTVPAVVEPTTVKPHEARALEQDPAVDEVDVALFPARAILFIPRWTFAALLWPVTEMLAILERHAVLERVEDFFYNDKRTAAILPIISLNTFFGASIGVRAFHNDLAGHGEKGEISATFGGRYNQAYEVSFDAKRTAGTALWLRSYTRFEAQRNQLFEGIGLLDEGGAGNDPRQVATDTRFSHQRLLLFNTVGYTLGEQGGRVQIGGTARYSNNSFGLGPDDKVSVGRVYDTTKLVGFDDGYSLLELGGDVIVDTRDVAGATSSGLYLHGFGGGAPPIGDYTFWRWGVEATGYIPLYRSTRIVDSRVLVLRAAMHAIEGDIERIPFTELPRIGGPNRLRGYPLDRFRDEKSFLATVEYHYPIHQNLGGALFLDAGKVGPDYRDLFDSTLPTLGGGFGLILRSEDSLTLSLDVAYGEGLQVHFTTDPLRAFEDLRESL